MGLAAAPRRPQLAFCTGDRGCYHTILRGNSEWRTGSSTFRFLLGMHGPEGVAAAAPGTDRRLCVGQHASLHGRGTFGAKEHRLDLIRSHHGLGQGFGLACKAALGLHFHTHCFCCGCESAAMGPRVSSASSVFTRAFLVSPESCLSSASAGSCRQGTEWDLCRSNAQPAPGQLLYILNRIAAHPDVLSAAWNMPPSTAKRVFHDSCELGQCCQCTRTTDVHGQHLVEPSDSLRRHVTP